ncbi:MAG: sensor histidine kinase [Spirulina sp. DLM2.Bin59]|nr:MAG: sensor histidine kinase [Spirulina sp. DLM2.Bin59]
MVDLNPSIPNSSPATISQSELTDIQTKLKEQQVLSQQLAAQLAQVQAELATLQAQFDQRLEAAIAEYSLDCQVRCAQTVVHQGVQSVETLRTLWTIERGQGQDDHDGALNKEKELSELKSRMIRTISHEYRTPLTVISLAAESLAHQYSRLNQKQRQNCFQQICRATQHMNKLINEVLWVSQAEAGEMVAIAQPVNLIQICRQSIDELAILHPEDGVRIHFHPQGTAVEAHLDPILLQQIFTHLLTNALKYSPPDQAVQFTATLTPDQGLFTIADHGIGIPPEDWPHLFDCFHRAGNVGTIPGTGLGLAIARKCVELLGGEIEFKSNPGVGSCFTVTVPRHLPA